MHGSIKEVACWVCNRINKWLVLRSSVVWFVQGRSEWFLAANTGLMWFTNDCNAKGRVTMPAGASYTEWLCLDSADTPLSCLTSGFVFLSVAWFWLSGEERHRPANFLLWLSLSLFHFHFHTPSSCLISGFVFLSVAWFWLSGEERHRPANLLLWLSATFEWIGREISHSCNCTRHGIKSGHLRWKKYIWEFSIKVGGNCSKSSHYMNDYMNYYKWCFTSFWMKRNTLAEACKLANLWRKLSLPG